MRKKSVKGFCITLGATLLLCGCGNDFPTMTQEQESQVAEYAAMTLLKYDANNRSRLVDLNMEEESSLEVPQQPSEPEPVEPEQPSVPETIPETPVIEIGSGNEAESLENFLDLPEGVIVAFAGQETSQSYAEDENAYFALEASEGKTLLVLHFILQNSSGEDQVINFLNRDDRYHIIVNEDYTRTALTTMLPNDMSTYKGTISAGNGESVVLIAEIDPEQVPNVATISLNLKNESKTYTIRLL